MNQQKQQIVVAVAAVTLLALLQGCLGQQEVSPTPSPWFECPISNGAVPNPYDCTRFFLCSNGQGWEQLCPPGLEFNAVTKQCDYPENAKCTPLVTNKAPLWRILGLQHEQDDDAVAVAFTCSATDGFYAPAGQCSAEYYACLGGTAYPYTCPTNSVFDPTINRCVPYEKASCATTPGSSPTTISTAPSTPTTTRTSTPTTTRPSGGFTCPESEGFFPIPNTCTGEYYVCVAGSPYVATCPGTSIFDPVTLNCKPAESASCNKFTCPASGGFYAIPGQYCTSNYYTCVSNEPYTTTCPGGAVFDPVALTCVSPGTGSCKTR